MEPRARALISEMPAPLVSVVVPSFNHTNFVVAALTSILDQTLADLELLVIDDGSRDDSVDRIRKFLAERGDRRAQLFARDNRGLCATLNEGLLRARGRYFAYLGSDDFWEPRKLALQVGAMEAAGRDVAACFSDCYIVDEGGKRVDRFGRMYRYRGGDIYGDLARMRFQPPSPTNFFVRERLLLAGGFNEARPLEDLDAWLRIARHYHVAYLDEPLASFRVHRTNTSTSHPQRMWESNRQSFDWLLYTDPSLRPWRRAIVARDRAGVAATLYNLGDYRRARHEAWFSLAEFPLDRLAWRMVVRSLVAESPLGEPLRRWWRRLRGVK